MRPDPSVLADLSVAFLPTRYIRVTPLAHRSTPLGTGYGATRFASPDRTFKLIYIAEDLETGLAETLIRDRFERRKRRRITISEAASWGVAEVSATAALTLVDLRTTGLLRLGVSTDAGRAKSHRHGRRLSAALYEQTDADGILYRSRLTNAICCAVYERSLAKLTAGAVHEIATLTTFVPALERLGIDLVP